MTETPSKSRVTLNDVAKAVGLSPGTVSDILNDRPGANYKQQTRDRVWEVVQQMGYAPNPRARLLAARRTREIGLLFTRGFENPFFGELASRFDNALRQCGYHMETAMATDWPEHGETEGRRLMALRVEGVLIGPIYGEREVEPMRRLRRLGVPTVFFGGPIGEVTPRDLVALDLASGGRITARHLLDAGHRRIGFLGGDSSDIPRPGSKEAGLP